MKTTATGDKVEVTIKTPKFYENWGKIKWESAESPQVTNWDGKTDTKKEKT
jgi:hypothetical protein